jgi:hypothetical protein
MHHARLQPTVRAFPHAQDLSRAQPPPFLQCTRTRRRNLRARKPTFDAQGYVPIRTRIDLRLPHRQPHRHRAYTTRIDRLLGARALRSYSPQPTRKQSRDISSHCVPQFSLPSDIDSAAYMCPSCPRCNPPRAPKHLAIWMSECTVHSA